MCWMYSSCQNAEKPKNEDNKGIEPPKVTFNYTKTGLNQPLREDVPEGGKVPENASK